MLARGRLPNFPLHGRTMFAPTIMFAIVCRGRRPRRPVLAPEGPDGEKQKSVKNRAELLHGLAFLLLDHLFGVPRGEQPLGRASRAIGSSGHFFGSFLVSKRNTWRENPIKKGSHRKVVTPDREQNYIHS